VPQNADGIRIEPPPSLPMVSVAMAVIAMLLSDVLSPQQSFVNTPESQRAANQIEAITGIKQRETIPDDIVRQADQIELVDMTAEALRRRMAHGNIYAPDKIDTALANYFRVGNLTALRELALPDAPSVTMLWTTDEEVGSETSRAVIESIMSRPIPGHVNTASVTRAPPRSWPIWTPAMVTMGIRLLGSTWCQRTPSALCPLDLAMRTNGRPRFSSTSVRVIRAISAVKKAPRVIAGRIT